jgi:gamma-glutamyltranspeptidase
MIIVVSSDTVGEYAYSKSYGSMELSVERLRLSGTEIYQNGGVAAEHPRCSEIGVQMMEMGGNAVDATIAGLLCVGVVNNFAAGIGGYSVKDNFKT